VIDRTNIVLELTINGEFAFIGITELLVL
jgi:hypothetical protein